MAKRRRSKAAKKSSKARPASPRAEVTRYEYAMLCMQLGTVEAQIARNRTDLEIQLRRIAQLQDEVEILKRSQRAPAAVAGDPPLIPLPKTTVES